MQSPIAPPRGLPRDASTTAREASDSWGDDAHSHSWLSRDELVAHSAALRAQSSRFGALIDDIAVLRGEARVVFWFDN